MTNTKKRQRQPRQEYMKAYMRQYRKDHPEVMKAQRVQYAIRLLEREGYTVCREEAKEPAPAEPNM